MAYGDFTATDLIRQFGVKFRAADLFPTVEPLPATTWLKEALRKGTELGFGSEKSRSERLVTPILVELSDLNQHQFAIYSGMNLDVDDAHGLRGECDFIFSFSQIPDFVASPVFCITEAKKQDLEQGTIKCAAQLIGARKLNDLENNSLTTLYGCSTTGVEWRFLKYEHNEIILDKKRYLISELDTLLGVLQTILTLSRQQLS